VNVLPGDNQHSPKKRAWTISARATFYGAEYLKYLGA